MRREAFYGEGNHIRHPNSPFCLPASKTSYPSETETIGDMIRHKFTREQLEIILDAQFEYGRDQQRQEDEEFLSRYRSKFSKLRYEYHAQVLLKNRYQEEADLLRQELSEVKDQLFALQLAYDELSIAHVESLPSEGIRGRNNFYGTSIKDERLDPPSTGSEEEPYSSSDEDFEVFQQVHAMEGSDESEDDVNCLEEDEVYSSDSESPPPGAVAGSSFGDDTNDNSEVKAREESIEPGIPQIQTIISKAYSGDQDARHEILTIIHTAEKTPKAGRTSVQRYVLSTWRRPRTNSNPCLQSSSSANSQPVSYAMVPISIPCKSWNKAQSPQPKAYVDASEYGIGFVLDKQWLAWTFVQGHPSLPLGPDDHLVMSWAEIIAVEMGVRTLVAAGYSNTSITLRSDNSGVVQAINTRVWTTNYGVLDVLKRIFALCEHFQLELRAKWVSTKVNPADKPSRGTYPSHTNIFPFLPIIPECLVEMVKDVV